MTSAEERRGFSDATAGRNPAQLDGPYMHGYRVGRQRVQRQKDAKAKQRSDRLMQASSSSSRLKTPGVSREQYEEVCRELAALKLEVSRLRQKARCHDEKIGEGRGYCPRCGWRKTKDG
jgi:hypothetical protein